MIKHLQTNAAHGPLSNSTKYRIADFAENDHGKARKAVGEHQSDGHCHQVGKAGNTATASGRIQGVDYIFE